MLTGTYSQIFSMPHFTVTFGIQEYDSMGELVPTNEAADIKGWVSINKQNKKRNSSNVILFRLLLYSLLHVHLEQLLCHTQQTS